MRPAWRETRLARDKGALSQSSGTPISQWPGQELWPIGLPRAKAPHTSYMEPTFPFFAAWISRPSHLEASHESRLVFIGRELDAERLKKSFEACQA